MTDIEALESGASEHSIESLEAEKHARDLEVQKLRAEMLRIHQLLEPRWEQRELAKAGPAHLSQKFTVGGVRLG